MRLSFRLFSFLFLLAAACSHAADSRPNIVLMMADDQGWGETGYNGHPHLKTPVLDEMSRSGLKLDRFYSASPVCSPTRASVLTGRHANRSGAFAPNYSTRPEEITIARILKDAGYRTGHFGKWHVGAVKKDSPTNPARMGFDEYLSHDNFFEMNPTLSRDGAPPELIQGESSEIVGDAAVKFAQKVRAEEKPFFMVVWFGSPHDPYSGTPEDVDLYKDVPSEKMRQRFAEITALDRAVGIFRASLKKLGVAGNTLLWYNSDNGIPVANENDSFNGGWRGHKGDIYEGGFRVPAVIEWPDVIQQPRVSDVRCVTSDILPTVLDLLQLKHPKPDRPLDGISLKTLLVDGRMKERPAPIGFWKYPANVENQNERWIDAELARGTTATTRNPAIDFANFKHPVAKTADFGGEAAWTDGRYKLVVIAAAGKIKAKEKAKDKDKDGDKHKKKNKTKADAATRAELYDLDADPKEQNDIAAANPEIVARMKAALEAWQTSVERSLSGADY